MKKWVGYLMSENSFSNDELLALNHNDHAWAFQGYLEGSRHSEDKQKFLLAWVNPSENDEILECGSSSGKTSIDFARKSSCYCLGIDFDEAAIEISSSMRDKYFPEVAARCQFEYGNLEEMTFTRGFNKVLMPDFTEHIPDEVFSRILTNIKSQLRDTRLYVYTPLRSHIFEILKHRNIVLKNQSGHINVKTEKELVSFLEENGWCIESITSRPSSIPLFKYVEMVFGHIPLIGRLFQRRIAIIATPATQVSAGV
jgi:hypothetical protein